jgi:hypothetical protein
LMFRTVFWQYNPEDSSEHHTRRREDLKSQWGFWSCRLWYLIVKTRRQILGNCVVICRDNLPNPCLLTAYDHGLVLFHCTLERQRLKQQTWET